MNILLVEDDQLSREMLSWRLQRKGFTVAVALDGAEALKMARSGAPALILLDMSLPVMDGWSVAQALKSDPVTQAIPVIALTAHAMRGDRERALEAGCDDYDTKPIEFARLLGKIDALLAPTALQPGG